MIWWGEGASGVPKERANPQGPEQRGTDTMNNEDRISELEIKLFYQEETIRELNGIVCEQQQRIDQLEKSMKAIASRFKDIIEAVGGKIPNEKPPHY